MRRSVAGLLLLAVLVLICASPAYAVTTNPGDRAPELAGWDIVGQRSVSIDDFRGQWVLVEFSAAWCRPCMKQLPDFLAAVQPYRASGQLTVIMVSLDTPETLPDMRRVIKDHAIDFPVLYDGGKYQSVPYLEWNVYGAPSTYLVDSQGVIAAAGLRGQSLAQVLAYYLDEPRPLVALRTRSARNPDGTISVIAEVTNPGHGPVELTLTRHREHCTALPGDASGRIDSFESHYDKGFASTTLSFDEFGETTYEFRLTPTDDMNVVGYKVHLQPPGSTVETGRGFDLQSQNDQAYYRGIERRPDGELYLVGGGAAQAWRTKIELGL